MSETVTAAGLTAVVIRKPIKCVYIRVQDGCVVMSAPLAVSREELERLLDKHSAALKKQLGPGGEFFAEGKPLPYLGKNYVQHYSPSDYVWEAAVEDGTIHIKCPAGWSQREKKDFFCSWYACRLSELLEELVPRWEQALGIRAEGGWKVGSWVSCWGKCNLKSRSLGFNAALAQAPVQVIESVVLHELLHLRIENHQKEFHDALKAGMPEIRACDEYLKNMFNVLK
ncbi:MAG: DUF45 domain-containing protein [Abditibacteriota bacterium]|nr:DUF45 domain-containing protein [Abditibacteriota bacterium]